jgi:hypothetical protein
MKNYINPSYTFTPGASGVGTVDTNIANFNIKLLVGIINITRETVIYWPSLTGRGYTNVAGDVITLEYSTVGHNSADLLQFVYDSTADYPVFSRDTVTNTGIGAPADSAASSDTGTFSIIAFIKRAMQNWTTLLNRVPASVSGRVPVDGSGVTQPVSGSVSVSNFPATQPVSGSVSVSNFPATQPVSGPLTDAQLRATSVPVSGPLTDAQLRATVVPVSVSNFPGTQPVSGSVSVSNFPATQPVSGPLTDSQLRATAVPVSGPLTDAQLRASAVPVSGPLTSAELASSEVVDALRQIQMEVEVLKNSIGQSRVDSGGRLRILLDSISASLTLATVTTVGTVTTVSTVTNQAQIGGVSAIDQVPSLRRQAADSLLMKINIT